MERSYFEQLSVDLCERVGDIVLKAKPDGTQLKVSDVALVVDGFADNAESSATLNGQPAAIVEVYRIGDETP